MATATPSTPASGAAPSGGKTKAQCASGKTKLDRIEAKVKENAHAARQNIARHLHDLEEKNARHVARAKREMKADVKKVKKATAELGGRFKKHNK